MSNSNAHNHFPLPNLVVGRRRGNASRAAGTSKYPDHTPMTNLLLSMLDKVGVPHGHARRQHGPRRDAVMRARRG